MYRPLRFLYLLSLLFDTAFGAPLCDAGELSVMSFNIRYANAGDGAYQWNARAEGVCAAIRWYAPDILGTQEVLYSQLTDMKLGLPEYGMVGVGRDDGATEGEYSALWYRTDRFEVADSGNFWLSATPDVPGSLGWDAACVRIATWAVLADRSTGQKLLALNTHLDHVGLQARRQGAALILHRADSLQQTYGLIPLVITGDFNSGPEDEVIGSMISSGRVCDSHDSAPCTYGPDWTFHNFDREPITERLRIDYIFYSHPLKPLRYGTIADRMESGLYLSDHCPVLAYFSW